MNALNHKKIKTLEKLSISGKWSKSPLQKMKRMHLRDLSCSKGLFNRLSIFGIEAQSFCCMGPHYHARTHEWFVVLKGHAKIFLGDQKKIVREGDYVYIPPGLPHTVITKKKSAKVLVLFSPKMNLSKPDICLCEQNIK